MHPLSFCYLFFIFLNRVFPKLKVRWVTPACSLQVPGEEKSSLIATTWFIWQSLRQLQCPILLMKHCRNANRQQPAWKSEIVEEKLLKKAEKLFYRKKKKTITISLRKAYGVLHKSFWRHTAISGWGNTLLRNDSYVIIYTSSCCPNSTTVVKLQISAK